MFHRYFSNLEEEGNIKAYCDALGVVFQSANALMLPLEKVLAYCGEPLFSSISRDDEAVIGNLAMPLKESLASAACAKREPCKLLEQQVTLNWKGEALLCCAVYDEKKFLVGNYLETSLEALQAARRRSEVCSTCIKHGASNYFLYNIPDMDTLVAENIRHHSKTIINR